MADPSPRPPSRCGPAACAAIVVAQTLLVFFLVAGRTGGGAVGDSALVAATPTSPPVHTACGATAFLTAPPPPDEIAAARAAAKRWLAVVAATAQKKRTFPAFWEHLRVSVSCPDLRRFGGRGKDSDGGKWVRVLHDAGPADSVGGRALAARLVGIERSPHRASQCYAIAYVRAAVRPVA